MNIREPQRHIWPWFANEDRKVVDKACLKSQSAKMIFGFFPPNSNDNFLNIGAAIFAIVSPVFVLPVNEMALILGSLVMASPTLCPKPCTIFKTPAGMPASMQISDNMNAVIGVISEGLATTQFPAARAGAIFQVNKYSGKFQGEIQPTTPIGLRNV